MAKRKGKTGPPTIENRRARFDYQITDKVEVGIALVGTEVKALRAGNASIAEGYVDVSGDPPQLTLLNATVGEYGPAGAHQHKLTRGRRLLAKRREIEKLARQVDQKGATLVPLRLFFNERGLVKLVIGLGIGRKTHDKRHAIRERQEKREMDRAMSRKV